MDTCPTTSRTKPNEVGYRKLPTKLKMQWNIKYEVEKSHTESKPHKKIRLDIL
jgi:hypothetical protein